MTETKEERSRIMRAVKGKDTGPEIAVRKLVHSMGFRYRLHRRDLPGVPDLVFGPKNKVLFVHGCFWHGHTCKRGDRIPKKNRKYWEDKIRRNVERDKNQLRELQKLGWKVLVLWECELKDEDYLRNKISSFLTDTRQLTN